MTLRVGDQLVGVRPDTDATAARIRTTFAAWLDPAAVGAHGEPVPWAFSLRLDTQRIGRGPRAVPQLRIGSRLLARSRHADDIVTALDQVLGGVLARQDDSRRWLGLRTFVAGDRAVLVDASPPALTADPTLARAGVTELPIWSVAVDGNAVHVPPPLTATAPADSSFVLAGLVALDACDHRPDTEQGDDRPADDHDADDHDADEHEADDPWAADRQADDHQAVHHPTNPGALLARFAARHPSNGWFHTVEALVADGRVRVSTDRAGAAEHLRWLLAADASAG